MLFRSHQVREAMHLPPYLRLQNLAQGGVQFRIQIFCTGSGYSARTGHLTIYYEHENEARSTKQVSITAHLLRWQSDANDEEMISRMQPSLPQ